MSRAGSQARDQPGPGESVSQTLRQLVRGIAGGLLLGLPPLFTMELWFDGFMLDSWKIVALIVFTFAIVVGNSAFSGFRRERTWPDLLVDSVTTMGIAAIVSAVALLLLGRIDAGIGLRDAVGKIALEMIPISLGVSLAGSQLADPEDKGEEAADIGGPVGKAAVGPYGRLLVAAGAALFLSINIAPTEETIFLVVSVSWWLLILVVLASLLMSYAIVFYADFRGGRMSSRGNGPLDDPFTETVVAYTVSLLVSTLLVWAFGYTESTTARVIIAQIVLLGVVAAFGGAAGRLLLGSGSTEDTGGSPQSG